MICVRAIIHFRPNEAYEKYLRLLAGIMIMIQLFLPVGRLILGKNGQGAAEVLQQFRGELERGMEEAAESAAAADALLEQMTLEEIQRRLEEQKLQENAADWEKNQGKGVTESREGNPGKKVTEGGTDMDGDGIHVQVEEISPVFIVPSPETQKEGGGEMQDGSVE